MVLSSKKSHKTPLHIDACWEKTTANFQLKLVKCIVQWKLALPARGNINHDKLRRHPITTVVYADQLVYEEQIVGHSQHMASGRLTRCGQLKVTWPNHSKGWKNFEFSVEICPGSLAIRTWYQCSAFDCHRN